MISFEAQDGLGPIGKSTMKKLLLVVAVGCSLSSITSAALAEGRQGPPHWPPPMLVEKRRKPTPVLHQGAELKTVRGRRDRIERAITAKRAPAEAGAVSRLCQVRLATRRCCSLMRRASS